MENNKLHTRLSLKKETITKLSSHQLKNIMGGKEDRPPEWSCIHHSCNSVGTGSCGHLSCMCDEGPVPPGPAAI